MLAIDTIDRRNAEILFEKQQLERVGSEIELGEKRLRGQLGLINSLSTKGLDTRQAERLAQLLDQTLLQWHHHRQLIEQRIAYLELLNENPFVQT
jgi:hypothetical protein